MTSKKDIGHIIQQIRKEKSMTQEDLAGLVEMDRSYLSEIESGYKNLSVEMLIKIADALEISPKRFFEESDQ